MLWLIPKTQAIFQADDPPSCSSLSSAVSNIPKGIPGMEFDKGRAHSRRRQRPGEMMMRKEESELVKFFLLNVMLCKIRQQKTTHMYVHGRS